MNNKKILEALRSALATYELCLKKEWDYGLIHFYRLNIGICYHLKEIAPSELDELSWYDIVEPFMSDNQLYIAPTGDSNCTHQERFGPRIKLLKQMIDHYTNEIFLEGEFQAINNEPIEDMLKMDPNVKY